ncbi:MAG: DUF134 domain-containing protein [Candidatus Kryptoniota bacterium]
MARPTSARKICHPPLYSYFMPVAHPTISREEIVLTLDELEAVRLADHEGLYQDDAAELMGISRQTFGRIIQSARKKIAGAIVTGRSIRVAGGEVDIRGKGFYHCYDCHFNWKVPEKRKCPQCGSNNVFRIVEG